MVCRKRAKCFVPCHLALSTGNGICTIWPMSCTDGLSEEGQVLVPCHLALSTGNLYCLTFIIYRQSVGRGPSTQYLVTWPSVQIMELVLFDLCRLEMVCRKRAKYFLPCHLGLCTGNFTIWPMYRTWWGAPRDSLSEEGQVLCTAPCHLPSVQVMEFVLFGPLTLRKCGGLNPVAGL
jgi:hypothetical protein